MTGDAGDPMGAIELLLVDDSQRDAQLILDVLLEAGMKVRATRVENEAYFRNALARRLPDAIFSDWSLPHFSGEQAFAIAREICPAVPFIFVSGTVSEAAAITVMRQGAVDFIFKHQLQLLSLALQRALQEVRSQRALREGDALNVAILDSVVAEIAVLNPEGVIIAVNESWRQFALRNGSDPDSTAPQTALGANYLAVCQKAQSSPAAADDAMRVRLGLDAVLNGNLAHFKMEYACHSPQERRWFSMNVTPLGHAPTRGAVVVHTNITERKEKELLLQTSQEAQQRHAHRVEALLSLSAASESLGEKDFMQYGQELAERLTGSQIAFIHFVNDDQESIELVTWSSGTLEHYCQASFDSHYPVSQAGIWADALRQRRPVVINDYASAAGKHGLPEGHAHLQRLISVPVIQGNLVRMMSGVGNKATDYSDWDVETVRLIAEAIWRIVRERRSDAAMRASEQRHRLLAENAVDVIWTMDLEGRFTYVSPSVEKLRGYTSEEVLQQPIEQALCPASAALATQSLGHSLAAIRAGLPFVAFNGELEQPCKDGTTVWTEVNTSGMRSEDGTYMGIIGVTRDISVRRAQQERINLSAQVFSQSREGITLTDLQGTIVMVNPAFTAVTGYSAEEALGQNPRILKSGRQEAAFYSAMWNQILTAGHWEGEIWNRNKNGSIYPEWLSISTLHDQHGMPTHYMASFTDLSATKAAENRIQWLSHFDTVTGLPNRTLLQDRAEQALSMVRRSNEPLTVMLASIDHFTAITDTLGYQDGDDLLKEVSQRLLSGVRAQDTVARLAGNEFVLMLPGTQAGGAAHLARDLLSALAQPYFQSRSPLSLTCSLGIATFPDNAADFDALLRAAQVAMHRSQAHARGSYQFYSPNMYEAALAREQMVKALQHAAALDQLHLVYQPQVDLKSGHICGLEALLRWTHPELGEVPPGTFIAVAEEAGLIVGIGHWVLQRACRDIRKWLDKGIKVPHVAINVSPLQFRDNDLIGQVKSALAEWRIDPSLLYIEVTESALMADAVRSEEMLRELNALSLKLSLDDFGTGYSSLSYLKRFPFDQVKIDQSFVRDLATEPSDMMLVKVIVSMAHGFGMRVIAEGVETEAQCEILRASVCDEIQGYFFSEPVSTQAIETLFEQGKQLPAHLLRERQPQRTLLLVDDEPNIVSAIKRLFRRDGHQILTANSGAEGLEVLAKHKVDLIISDQRMPGMTGVEFLRKAKISYPDTVRIVLSGYTELQSVTDAINEGAVYRFLTKPWEDEVLREQIQNALEYRELLDKNRQLDIKIHSANQELVATNRQLGNLLQQKREQIERGANSLSIAREALEWVPMPVLGIDDLGTIVFANSAAQKTLAGQGLLTGAMLAHALADIHAVVAATTHDGDCTLQIDRVWYRVQWRSIGSNPLARGKLITLLAADAPASAHPLSNRRTGTGASSA